MTRSAAAKQPEASSRHVMRSQGRAGQGGHAAAKQPEPSSSRMTLLRGSAEQGSEQPAPLAQGSAHRDAEATAES